jgi:hypothetical protein
MRRMCIEDIGRPHAPRWLPVVLTAEDALGLS